MNRGTSGLACGRSNHRSILSALSKSTSLLLRLLGLEFFYVFGRVRAKLRSAAATADVVGDTIVGHGRSAQAAADNAFRLICAGGEAYAFLGGANLEDVAK